MRRIKRRKQAMKITRHGTKPEELAFQFTCHKCKTIFEFQASEAKYFDTQKDGEF